MQESCDVFVKLSFPMILQILDRKKNGGAIGLWMALLYFSGGLGFQYKINVPTIGRRCNLSHSAAYSAFKKCVEFEWIKVIKKEFKGKSIIYTIEIVHAESSSSLKEIPFRFAEQHKYLEERYGRKFDMRIRKQQTVNSDLSDFGVYPLNTENETISVESTSVESSMDVYREKELHSNICNYSNKQSFSKKPNLYLVSDTTSNVSRETEHTCLVKRNISRSKIESRSKFLLRKNRIRNFSSKNPELISQINEKEKKEILLIPTKTEIEGRRKDQKNELDQKREDQKNELDQKIRKEEIRKEEIRKKDKEIDKKIPKEISNKHPSYARKGEAPNPPIARPLPFPFQGRESDWADVGGIAGDKNQCLEKLNIGEKMEGKPLIEKITRKEFFAMKDTSADRDKNISCMSERPLIHWDDKEIAEWGYDLCNHIIGYAEGSYRQPVEKSLYVMLAKGFATISFDSSEVYRRADMQRTDLDGILESKGTRRMFLAYIDSDLPEKDYLEKISSGLGIADTTGFFILDGSKVDDAFNAISQSVKDHETPKRLHVLNIKEKTYLYLKFTSDGFIGKKRALQPLAIRDIDVFEKPKQSVLVQSYKEESNVKSSVNDNVKPLLSKEEKIAQRVLKKEKAASALKPASQCENIDYSLVALKKEKDRQKEEQKQQAIDRAIKKRNIDVKEYVSRFDNVKEIIEDLKETGGANYAPNLCHAWLKKECDKKEITIMEYDGKRSKNWKSYVDRCAKNNVDPLEFLSWSVMNFERIKNDIWQFKKTDISSDLLTSDRFFELNLNGFYRNKNIILGYKKLENSMDDREKNIKLVEDLKNFFGKGD